MILYTNSKMNNLTIIGHRGARGLAPENTIKGIKKALEYQVDQIELDVRVSADDVAVLHHDRYVKNPAGQRRLISNTSFSELKQFKPDLTTLAEALEVIEGAKPLYLDVKPGVDTQPIVPILKDYKHPLLVASFSKKVLTEIHAALPELELAVADAWSGVRATRRARSLGARTITMNHLWLWPGFVRSIKRSDYRLYAFTVNDIGRARRLQRWGIDAIFTDRPDLFKKS